MSSPRSSAVVVVPCFNEAHRLDPDGFEDLLSDCSITVLFVDDGSTDGTGEFIERRFGERADLAVLPANVGKGEAVRMGMLRAIRDGADLVGYLDADLASPATELRRVLDCIAADPSLHAALGSRVRLLGRHIDRSSTRHVQGRVFATMASLVLGLGVYDTQCGLKMFRVNDRLVGALADPFRSRWVFDVELIGRLVTGPQAIGASAFVEVPLLEWRDVGASHFGLSARVRGMYDLVAVIAPDLRRRRRAAQRQA
jgi:dolichyl-phosphate beta-glucosyltransferase